MSYLDSSGLSTLWAKIKGMFATKIELATKQDTLTFDTTPTTNSTNPVTSGGVKAALDAKANQATTYTKEEINSLLNPIGAEIVWVAAEDWPLATGEANTIYCVQGTTSFTCYGWTGSDFQELATNNWIVDAVPTEGSANAVSSGGVYEATQDGKEAKAIVDDIATQGATVEPKNWLNFSDPDYLEGYRIRAGVISAQSNYNSSGYIPLKQGQTYVYAYGNSLSTARTIYRVNFYDDNKNYLSQIEDGTSFTPPLNAAYARITAAKTYYYSGGLCMLYYGAAPSEYSAYFTPYISPATLNDNVVTSNSIEGGAITLDKIASSAVDSSITENSTKLPTSGAVYDFVMNDETRILVDGFEETATDTKTYAVTATRMRELFLSGFIIPTGVPFSININSSCEWDRLILKYNADDNEHIIINNAKNDMTYFFTIEEEVTKIYVDFVSGISTAGDFTLTLNCKINSAIETLDEQANAIANLEREIGLFSVERTATYMPTVSRVRERLINNLTIKSGEKFTIAIDSTCEWPRLIIKYNGKVNQLKDYAVNNTKYTFIAPDDVQSIWVDFVDGIETGGTFTLNVGVPGLKGEIDEMASFTSNDICMPAKLYMLDGVVNDIFVEPIIKRWKPYDFDVIFGGSANYLRQLKRVVSVKTPVADKTITTNLYNRTTFTKIKGITSKIVKGTPAVGDSNIKLCIIGDSFTNNGAFYKNALLANGYVPNLTMIGLRYVTGYTSFFDEGHGGWALDDFFTISKKKGAFNPFMQPSDKGKSFWGSKQFWVIAWKCKRGTATSDETYSASRYSDSTLAMFDETTGLLMSPNNGDIMYDVDNEKFIEWNGSAWIDKVESDYTWAFSFGKYLSMWNLSTPNILAMELGANDWRNKDNPESLDFTEWNAKIETVIASFQSVNANGKFVYLIPSSTCGSENNTDGRFTAKQNACMWNVRKNLIDNFDAREEEGIYLVELGATIDSEYGFDLSSNEEIIKPFDTYSGTERLKVQTGVPHPYANYGTTGYPLAAFIQSQR